MTFPSKKKALKVANKFGYRNGHRLIVRGKTYWLYIGPRGGMQLLTQAQYNAKQRKAKPSKRPSGNRIDRDRKLIEKQCGPRQYPAGTYRCPYPSKAMTIRAMKAGWHGPSTSLYMKQRGKKEPKMVRTWITPGGAVKFGPI